MQVESPVPRGSCWLQWAGWVCPAGLGLGLGLVRPNVGFWRPGWTCSTGLVELLCFPAVGVTAPWCTVVLWSTSPLHIRGYRKGKNLLNFIKCMIFPPRQPVLVSLVIPVLTCIPGSNALRTDTGISPAVEIPSCSSTAWLLELGSGLTKQSVKMLKGN